MAKYKFNSGGQVRNAPIVIKKVKARRKPDRKKGTRAGKVLLGVITGVNVLLSILLKVLDRQEVIHAVKENDDVKLLLTAKLPKEKEKKEKK